MLRVKRGSTQCDHTIWEAEAGRAQVQSQIELHNETCLRKKKVVTPIKNKIGQTVGSGDLRQMSECPIPHGEHPEEL
jgi:hypothetical protein